MLNYTYFFIYWFLIILVIFFLLSHPLVMGLLLIINTFFMCMFIMLFSYSSWNSYILFLMFLGGVLILFLYNISLISSEMFFYFNFKDTMIMFLIFFFLYLFFYFKEGNLNDMMNFMFVKESSPIMLLFFNVNTILFLMIYLFFSLICIVNLIYFFKDKGSMLFKK